MVAFPVFQPVFWRLFLSLCTLLLPIIGLVGYLTAGARVSLIVEQSMRFGLGGKIAMLGLLLLGMLLAVIAFSTLTLTRRIIFHVRDTGIAAPTMFGRLVFIAWEEVSEVRRIRLPLVPFLRIAAPNKPPIYGPLFVVGLGELAKAIREFAPDGHPIKSAMAGPNRKTAQ